MSERTVYRRLEDPAFRARLNEARSLALGQALGRLTWGAPRLPRRRCSRSSAATRPPPSGCAAVAALEPAGKLRESIALEERIAALEDALAERPRRIA